MLWVFLLKNVCSSFSFIERRCFILRINNDNYDEYINSNYPRAIFIKEETYYSEPYYLQKNFGGLNDCTIMSISYMIKQKNIMRFMKQLKKPQSAIFIKKILEQFQFL